MNATASTANTVYTVIALIVFNLALDVTILFAPSPLRSRHL